MPAHQSAHKEKKEAIVSACSSRDFAQGKRQALRTEGFKETDLFRKECGEVLA